MNQWDLVDQSAPHLLGPELERGNESLMKELAEAAQWWRRRAVIVATLYLIRKGQFEMTFTIAKLLEKDEHPLVRKGVAWMLREVAKQTPTDFASS